MLDGLNSASLVQVLLAVLPAWLFGAFVGYLVGCRDAPDPLHAAEPALTRPPAPQLPRPRWLTSGTKSGAAWVFGAPPGSGIRRMALLYHAAVICREVWCHFTAPGTFRGYLRGAWRAVGGKGSGQPAAEIASGASRIAAHQHDSW